MQSTTKGVGAPARSNAVCCAVLRPSRSPSSSLLVFSPIYLLQVCIVITAVEE